ncbi:MAG: hypothetical protein JO257_12020 [Deltaproteobacteria bacterium]|nr:hypothetical protein [Deltaproteobacteria bacterium]
MISSELELAHLDARHWRNGMRLLMPPRVLDQPRWALAVREGGQVIKLVIAGPGAPGAIDPVPLRGTSQKELESYAKQLGVASVIVADNDLIAKLSAEIESALRLDMDGVAQALVALRALKRHAGHGLWTEPPILDLLPAPGFEPIQKTFDLLVPDHSALVAYVIEDDRSRIHTSIIAVKDDGDITRAAGHRAIADLVPEVAFARDWQKGYKRVLAAVEERFAKPSIALFLERKTLLDIVTGPSDQLARELNAKRVVIDPAPAWLLGLLGGAAALAMAGRAAKGIAAMMPKGARDAASALAARATTAVRESGPFAALGFDPIELWSRLKHFYRAPE